MKLNASFYNLCSGTIRTELQNYHQTENLELRASKRPLCEEIVIWDPTLNYIQTCGLLEHDGQTPKYIKSLFILKPVCRFRFFFWPDFDNRLKQVVLEEENLILEIQLVREKVENKNLGLVGKRVQS